MTTIVIPRVRPATFDADRLRLVGDRLEIRGELRESEDAIVLASESGAIVHGQPTNRLGGLTTAIDTKRGIAPDIDADGNHKREVLDPDRATDVVKELLDRAGLATVRTKTDLELDVRTDARVTEGVRFDGKERTRFAVKTDVRARVTVNGLTVTGPRAGLSATFTDSDQPVRLFAASWDAIETFDERPLVDKDEAIADLLATRPERHDKRSPVDVIEATLGYWAGEYGGGADVLEPSWFVEIEHRLDGKGGIPPRKLVRLPATRR